MKPKILFWNGENKSLVREKKIETSLRYYEPDTSVISLPGSYCKFEHGLAQGGIPSDRIVGIQSVYSLPNHNGEEIYKNILENKKGSLQGIKLWPGDIFDFFKRLRRGRVKKTNIKPKVLEYLDTNILSEKVNNISIIDIDLCGIFSKKLTKIINEIYKTKTLNDRFILFLNVQKGRDVRGGKLYKLIRKFGIKTNDLERIRYFYFPYIILSIGKKYGYKGNVMNLYEYSDKNENNIGVNMLQFVFRFYKTDKDIPEPVRRAGYYYYEFIGKDD